MNGTVGTNSGVRQVLVIEQDAAVRSACIDIARGRDFVAAGVVNPDELRIFSNAKWPDILLMALEPDLHSSLAFIRQVRAESPNTSIVVMSANPSIFSAVEAVRSGAVEYLTKPFNLGQLGAALQRAAEQSRKSNPNGALRCSHDMERIYRMLPKVAQSHHPVLILGEPGSGKKTLARTIHAQSDSASQPFIVIECNAFAVRESEEALFGYIEGALAPPSFQNNGALISAGKGTVFLDNVGQLHPELQCKLFRVMQEKVIRPAGSSPIPISARIFAASTTDLSTAVKKGEFRKDLYQRLSLVTLRIAPLRERCSEIPQLATNILQSIAAASGRNFRITEDTLNSLMNYDWPGNISELENTVHRACTMSEGPLIHLGDLPTQVRTHELDLRRELNSEAAIVAPALKPAAIHNVKALADLERDAILATIQQLKGDKLLAAQMLGIGKTTLYRKLKEYGVMENVTLELRF